MRRRQKVGFGEFELDEKMINLYVLATFLFYAASLALYIWNLRDPSRPTGIGATVCLIGGLALH